MAQVFISYAHDDNRTLDESQRGWVSHLYLALEQELIERGLLDLNLWRDKRETRPYEQFADDIEAGLKASQLLVSVLSPVYVQKSWCARELETFGALLDGDARPQRERVLKVIKRDVPRDKVPKLLQGQEGYRFFEVSGEDRSEIPLYHPGRGAREQYWDVVGRLADDIATLIRERFDGAPAVAPDSPAPEGARFTAFLAPVTDDLMDEARRLRGELEAAGARVVPEAGALLPTSAEALRATLAALLEEADLAVHLIGARPGFTPDGASSPVVALQLEAAAAAGRRRVIWCRPQGEGRDPRLAEVVDALRAGRTLGAADELVEEGYDRLKGFLLPLVTGATAPAEPAAAPPVEPDALLQALSQLPAEQLAQLLKAKLESG